MLDQMSVLDKLGDLLHKPQRVGVYLYIISHAFMHAFVMDLLQQTHISLRHRVKWARATALCKSAS